MKYSVSFELTQYHKVMHERIGKGKEVTWYHVKTITGISMDIGYPERMEQYLKVEYLRKTWHYALAVMLQHELPQDAELGMWTSKNGGKWEHENI